MKKNDDKNVIYYTTKILELKPDSVKAHYRRCLSYINIGNVFKQLMNQMTQAKEDLEKLELLIPNTEELKLVYQRYNDCFSKQNIEEKKVFKKMAKTFYYESKSLLN